MLPILFVFIYRDAYKSYIFSLEFLFQFLKCWDFPTARQAPSSPYIYISYFSFEIVQRGSASVEILIIRELRRKLACCKFACYLIGFFSCFFYLFVGYILIDEIQKFFVQWIVSRDQRNYSLSQISTNVIGFQSINSRDKLFYILWIVRIGDNCIELITHQITVSIYQAVLLSIVIVNSISFCIEIIR